MPFGLKCVSICYINYIRKLSKVFIPRRNNQSFKLKKEKKRKREKNKTK